MSIMPWFRLYSEFATDPKVQMLSESDQRRYIMLLCLRCSNGTVTLHDDEIAFQLRISNDEWAATKAILVNKGLIKDCNEICNWSEMTSTDRSRQSPEVWKKTRDRFFRRDNYTCGYCGAFGVRLECDHIHPIALGGLNDDANLITACFACNRSKHSKTLEQWQGGRHV